MAQASYSFLDVAALEGVRERFATGDALAILSADLEEVIWANGPGAALLGHADVETIFGAEAPLSAAAKRQIAAVRGFPDIGRDRALLVRIAKGVNSSQALPFFASAVTLPDGEKAILLAQPAKGEDAAAKALGGFAEPGHFVAFVDRAGAVEAASRGFERLGLKPEALAELASEAADDRRIVKRLVAGRRGPLPAGLAKLTDDRNLLVVIDERYAEEDDDAAEPEAVEPEPAREIWYLGSDQVRTVQAAAEQAPAPAAEPEVQEADAEPTIVESAAEQIGEQAVAASETSAEEHPIAAVAEPAVKEESAVAPVAEVPAEPVREEERGAASVEGAPAQRAAGAVRFVWRTDADGKFSQISPEFALAVGEEAADIVGRRFQDVANAFGLDPSGDITGLLARLDTWSGRSVYWPVARTDLKIPVDLAALPVYDRNRNFEGFRGFGVARPADATVDPEGIGLTLVRLPPAREAPAEAASKTPDVEAEAPQEPEAGNAASTADENRSPEEKPADPFRGEKPVLTIVPAPDRRYSDKVIRLAEHRPPTQERGPAQGSEKALSTGERLAFQQIGERLKKESGQAAADRKADVPEARGPAAGAGADNANEAPKPAESEGARAPDITEIADEEIGDAEAIADLQALDGVAGTDVPSAETPADARMATSADAAEAGSGVESEAPLPVPETAEPARRPRKGQRPGLSLLDFAEWGREEPVAEADGTAQQDVRPAALVEMEEAAALDEYAPKAPAPEDEPAEDQPVPGDSVATDAEAAEAGTAEIESEDTHGLMSRDGAPAEPEVPPATAEKSGAGFSILEKLPVPVLVHSGDLLHYANDEFFALTGYRSIEDLAEAGGIGALFADPYEDGAGFEHDAEARRKSDRHMRLKTRDGQELPVEAFLQSVPWGSGKALILVLSRVKEGFGGQSPLIAELEARVAEMRTIIDTATDGVVLIARDGTIRSISRPAEALFGSDSDEVAGKPFFSLFAIESQQAARDYLNGLTDHGVASVLNDGREVIGREAEGRFIPLFMTIGKLPGDSGYCAVVRDITQWKRAEEELTQARATAERSSSHKTEFLARVSHEIRTPLNAIIGFSELMLDEKFGPVANDRYRDYLRDINRSGNHVLDLVNDLLDISKIEAGQQEMAYEAVSLNDTLAETVALMQPQANRERVIIRSSLASKLPDVVADLRSVRQIALNILSNAVRYTQAGGQVIVSTAYEAQGEVVMRVRDTGIGMTPAEIEQALKPFKQINSLKRTRGDGTGLGLPLTKAMVEANRAKFSIHSTPGEGTLVEVAFPPTRVLAD